MNKYSEFLNNKKFILESSGFEIERSQLNPNLFDFQKDIVRWALAKGRAAIFASCGLGKTLMQLEWAYRICKHVGKSAKVLILAPLAVSTQTVREGVSIQCECEGGCGFSILIYFFKGGCYMESAPPNSYRTKDSFANNPCPKPLLY